MQITRYNLKENLNKLLLDLNKGERVRVKFGPGAETLYIDTLIKNPVYEPLLHTTDSYGNDYIGRVK